jgi:hypothetical protein
MQRVSNGVASSSRSHCDALRLRPVTGLNEPLSFVDAAEPILPADDRDLERLVRPKGPSHHPKSLSSNGFFRPRCARIRCSPCPPSARSRAFPWPALVSKFDSTARPDPLATGLSVALPLSLVRGNDVCNEMALPPVRQLERTSCLPFFADSSKFIEPIECDKCGESVYVIRRALHPDIPHVEIQTFQCPICGHQMEQSVPL